MKRLIIFVVCLAATSAHAATYTVTPISKSPTAAALTGPELPVIPGNVVATGHHRPFTPDERKARELLRKAYKLAGAPVPAAPQPCVVPIVAVKLNATDQPLAIVADDHCNVRIEYATPLPTAVRGP
jgi:hypothetical protein